VGGVGQTQHQPDEKTAVEHALNTCERREVWKCAFKNDSTNPF
jgi:hypothetical protein